YFVVVSNYAGLATSSNAFMTVNQNPPITNSLVVHLNFDGDFRDSSGRGNHGTAIGSPNLVPGVIGTGGLNPFSLSTNNHFVTLGSPSDLKFGSNTDFSVAFWVRQPAGSWSGSYNDPVYIGNKDWSSGANVGWLLGTETAG